MTVNGFKTRYAFVPPIEFSASTYLNLIHAKYGGEHSTYQRNDIICGSLTGRRVTFKIDEATMYTIRQDGTPGDASEGSVTVEVVESGSLLTNLEIFFPRDTPKALNPFAPSSVMVPTIGIMLQNCTDERLRGILNKLTLPGLECVIS